MENNANVHRGLIAEVEKITKRNLIWYYGNSSHPAAALQDHDPDILENILRSLDLDLYEKKVDLVVSSPGGFPYAAGKMVKVCRTFASEFRAIVVDRALSAGTLICLGAQDLLMAETASLGPIDPQMVRGTQQGQRLVPASVILESFQEMLRAGTTSDCK